MPNTYSQIFLQFIFAVKYRESCIEDSWQEDLNRYITGIVAHNKHKLLAINGMPDHIHILAGFRPIQSVADLLRVIKTNSSKWINDNNLTPYRFEWQTGYGAFSYSKSELDSVILYIKNQKHHHTAMTFREEYIQHLEKFGIDFEEAYIFNELE